MKEQQYYSSYYTHVDDLTQQATIKMSTTLIPSGDREVVDASRAIEIVSQWKEQMTNLAVDKVVLTNKSYTSEAAQILKEFFLSSGVT